MTAVTPNIAAEIERHHLLAARHADAAIDHARKAGELLIKVKASLQHGAWLDWLSNNCTVSARQAQRYIRVANGLPMAIKRDTVSHLPAPPTEQAELPVKAGFAAIPDHAMWTVQGERCYFIEQSTVPGYFFVSCVAVPLINDDAVMDYLTKPIRGDYVDLPLSEWGLDEPAGAAWRWCRQERPASAALTMGVAAWT